MSVGPADQHLTVVSVCTVRDIGIWRHVALALPRYVQASAYIVIVPDEHVAEFSADARGVIKVICENDFVSFKLREQILSRLGESGLEARFGWYLQQFVKLSALRRFAASGDVLIWDADTLPISDIKFIDSENRVCLFYSDENHPPYFSTTKRLLGLGKSFSGSFIAQCLYMRQAWSNEFFATVEARNTLPWTEAVLAAIDFSEKSSFSEYETLGTFVIAKHSSDVFKFSTRWCRRGGMIFGTPEFLTRMIWLLSIFSIKYVAFERWDSRRVVFKAVMFHATRGVARLMKWRAKR